MITCQNCRNVLDTQPGMVGDFSCPYCGALIRIPPQIVPQAYAAPPAAPPVAPPVIYDAQPVVNVNPYTAPRTTHYTARRRRSSGVLLWSFAMIPLFFVLIIGGYFVSRSMLYRAYDRDIGFRVLVNRDADQEQVRGPEYIDDYTATRRVLGNMAIDDAMLWGFLGTPVVWGIGFAVIQLRRRD